MVRLRIAYLAETENFLLKVCKSMLVPWKKFKNVKKCKKKWGFKKLYMKAKKILKAKSWTYKIMPNTL